MRARSVFAGLILTGLSGAPIRAQDVPFLVTDLNPSTRDADVADLTVSGGSLFFGAVDGLEGVFGGELWKTDGTAAGTVLVKDIVPGSQGSGPRELTDVGGTLFFTATSGSFTQVWKTDGTAGGTLALGGGFGPADLTGVGSSLFFTSFEFTNCQELWTSDGTPAGTVLVKDINPGCECTPGEHITCTGHSQPQFLTDVNGTLFFSATDGSSGTELWMSDGTAAGTVMVKDINPGSASSSPTQLTNVGGVLFFAATDGVNGTELWTSDGTGIGTVMVKDINPGAAGSSPRAYHAASGVLYFRAAEPATGHELWTSDGTEIGTVQVADINPGPGGSSPPTTSPPSDPIVDVAGTLFFAANDGTSGSELWTSNGTALGTTLVRDINAGPSSSDIFHLTPHGGDVFFRAFAPATGTELWRSNGTSAGTVLVKDFNPGIGFANPSQLTSFAGALFLVPFEPTVGRELFRTDGTAAGTTLVLDINTDSLDSAITNLSAVDGTVFFRNADALHGEELWASDGTPAGTRLVKDIVPGPPGALSDILCSVCRERVSMNGILFFTAAGPGSGVELWRSNGTEAGTTLVKDVRPGSGSSRPEGLTVLGNTLYFSADAPGTGRELWRSDGTEMGTVLVTDIALGPTGSSPGDIRVVNGMLFFRAEEPATGAELWRSDGTAAGTMLVKDINPGPDHSIPFYITDVGGRAFFRAIEPATGDELWASDGTAAGTVLVSDTVPGSTGSNPHELTEVNGRLFFVASELTNGDEVWTSDGTAGGTFLLKDINPGLGGGFGIHEPTALTSFEGFLFFSAFEPSTQQELWRSDGTSAGTVLVKDIYPGGIGSGPRELRVLNGSLYFRAFDPDHGYELWRSDGTTSGTVRVADIAPGLRSSEPQGLTVADGRLYFTAFTVATGRELWALDPCAPGDLCTGVCGTASCATILGHTFRSRDPNPGVERSHRVTVVAREPASPDMLVGDPTTSGAVLQVMASGGVPTSQTFILPAGPAWRRLQSGFAYADRNGTNGPVAALVVKHRLGSPFVLKVRLRGGGASLGVTPPDPGDEGGLRLRIGDGSGYCVRFGGPAGGRVRNLGAQLFEVVRPSAESGCP